MFALTSTRSNLMSRLVRQNDRLGNGSVSAGTEALYRNPFSARLTVSPPATIK